MFLKVGRPAWELKIETERLKDEINNDSDKVRATRSKKKSNYDLTKLPQSMIDAAKGSQRGLKDLQL